MAIHFNEFLVRFDSIIEQDSIPVYSLRRVGPDKGGHWEVLDKNEESTQE